MRDIRQRLDISPVQHDPDNSREVGARQAGTFGSSVTQLYPCSFFGQIGAKIAATLHQGVCEWEIKPLATDAAWDECLPEDKGAWENEAGRQIDRSMRPVEA